MIIGITGMNGCGKSSVADYLKEKHGFQYFNLADVIREEAKARKLDLKTDTLIRLGVELRTKHGNSVLAERILPRLLPGKKYIVDSIRHPAEIFALRKNPEFHLITVKASPLERFKRVNERKREGEKINLKKFMDRDSVSFYSPKAGQQIGICESMAHYTIMSIGTKEELYEKVEKMLEFFRFDNAMKIKIKKIHPNAIIPSYEHDGDSGMDVCSVHDVILNPRERTLVKTGLTFEIPKGYEIQVRPKSGLALKEGITCLNTPCTIDSNYRGELGVILINHSSKPFKVVKGKKVAQLVIQKVENAVFEEVKAVNKTTRGEGAFGSTGLYYK